MEVKFIWGPDLQHLEDEVNEFCGHERVIDVSLGWNMNVWVATITYQPVVHCDDHVFDENL